MLVPVSLFVLFFSQNLVQKQGAHIIQKCWSPTNRKIRKIVKQSKFGRKTRDEDAHMKRENKSVHHDGYLFIWNVTQSHETHASTSSPFFLLFRSSLLLSSFLTCIIEGFYYPQRYSGPPRGHRCRPFCPPARAFIFVPHRVGSAFSPLVDFLLIMLLTQALALYA